MNSDFRIASWLVEPGRNIISEDGRIVHLEPKVMQVLVCLKDHSGETVPKEKLIGCVWGDTFVTDDVLTRCISELRRAFGDSARESQFIQTISKRGYRLVPLILPADKLVEAGAPDRSNEESQGGSRRAKHNSKLRWIAAAGIVAGAILIAAVFAPPTLRNWISDGNAQPRISSLAVLPLANLSADRDQQYFSEAMTDALITELSQIGALKVVSRTSTEKYEKTDKSLPEIARELGVDAVVEGTVQRSGDRLRITTQLIYAPTDKHIWAKSYEGSTANVFDVEQDVAQAIATEVRANLTPREEARLGRTRSLSLDSLETYLQGRYHLEQAMGHAYRNGEHEAQLKEFDAARELFEKAIQTDPQYAQAYVGIARTWADQTVAAGGPEKADKALRKAISLDPELAEAHEALATLDVLRLWRWNEAEQEYKRAIELNPNFAEAHARFAEYYDCMGRFDEGMKEFLLAQQLDPGHSFQPNPFYRRRQYDRAIEIDQNEVKRGAFSFWPHTDLAFDYEGVGRHDEAAREWEEMPRMLGYTELSDEMHRELMRSGYRGSILILAKGMETERAKGNDVTSGYPAMMYTVLGERDKAFKWLEKGYLERDPAYSALNADPIWDPIRDDSRFMDLSHRIGLPDFDSRKMSNSKQ